MTALDQLANRLRAFNVNRTIESILNQDKYKKLVPDLIKGRLNKFGTYSDGSSIVTYSAGDGEVYSFVTMAIKLEKGQQTDKVTLKDTGKFHETFSLNPEPDQFSVEFDDSKPDGDISQSVPLLDDAVTLDGEGLTALQRAILPDFIQELKGVLHA